MNSNLKPLPNLLRLAACRELLVRARALGSPFVLAAAMGAATFLMTGCLETVPSDTVDPKVVYQDLSLTYDEGERKLEARAEFGVGGAWGTRLRLVEPSVIRFNGEIMPEATGWDSLFTTNYLLRKSNGAPGALHTFEFVDQEGASYVNSGRVTPVRVLSAPGMIAAGAYPEFRVEAQAAHARAGWTVIVGTREDDSVTVCSLAARYAEGRVAVDSANVPAGACPQLASHGQRLKVRLERSEGQSLAQATAEGGSLRLTYRTREYDARVVAPSTPASLP